MYDILVPWISASSSKEYMQYGGYHTGVDIKGAAPLSICDGVVIDIGRNADGFVIAVQYDKTQALRYLHIDHTDLTPGQLVKRGQLIGLANKFFHLEYITASQGPSIWPVRIGSLTYFKQDPAPVLEGNVEFKSESDEWYYELDIYLEGEV